MEKLEINTRWEIKVEFRIDSLHSVRALERFLLTGEIVVCRLNYYEPFIEWRYFE